MRSRDRKWAWQPQKFPATFCINAFTRPKVGVATPKISSYILYECFHVTESGRGNPKNLRRALRAADSTPLSNFLHPPLEYDRHVSTNHAYPSTCLVPSLYLCPTNFQLLATPLFSGLYAGGVRGVRTNPPLCSRGLTCSKKEIS